MAIRVEPGVICAASPQRVPRLAVQMGQQIGSCRVG